MTMRYGNMHIGNYLIINSIKIKCIPLGSSLNQELVLAKDDFKEKLEQMTKRQVNPAAIGRPKISEEYGDYLIL